LAHSGTILLDEVSEISSQVQAKLLRVLQERELERVGGNRTIKVDVRVIATTNRRLEESVERKEFRQDLFFRLNVVPIHVAPLREHKEDVPYLAQQFMPRFARKHGVRMRGFSDACMAVLQSHRWPGNVRELQNVIERAVILCGDGGMLEPEHLGFSPQSAAPTATHAAPDVAASAPAAAPHATPAEAGPVSLAELEKKHILSVMEATPSRTAAAKVLGISIRTLRNKLKEYGVNNKDDDDESDTTEIKREGDGT
jgi:transcriptional regulator with PAS, ATPase and Fis domain